MSLAPQRLRASAARQAAVVWNWLERSPGFDTILKVMGALGLTLHAEAIRG